MFEQENYAALVASVRRMADSRNAMAAYNFKQEAENWAANFRQTGIRTPPPVALPAIEMIAIRETMMPEVKILNHPVSDLNPESLLPRFATDDGAIGGRIGGPMPNTDGCYYEASGATSAAGDTETVGGVTYTFRAPMFGLGGFWVRVPAADKNA